MQTLRFNPFNQVHKGLRALLYDTALLVQHTDFTNKEETGRTAARVRFVNELFAHHAHVEDNLVFPMIASHAPGIVADFESQHQTDHELSANLEICLSRFGETNSPEQDVAVGNELLQSFNSFLAFNVEHMKKEETVVNAVLWKHYSDAQLIAKTQEISASLSMEEKLVHSAWMLKGSAVHEIVAWYRGIQKGAPPFVFENFCRLAESTLSPARWDRVKANLELAVAS